jgi:hypothetical protein
MPRRTTKLKIRALLERILLGEILGVLGALAVNAGRSFTAKAPRTPRKR